MVRASVSSVLVKPVSADCNLACKYCFYSPKIALYPETKRHQMSDRVLRELIAQVMSLSLDRVSFCWQGGEPTLAGLGFYRRVIEYQSQFRIPGQVVENSIQTNGTLINEEWARFLSRHGFLVGVSLDGPKELHDYYRKDRFGGGSYEKVMAGIESLRKYDVNFNILVLLNNMNVKHPKELYRFFLNKGFRYLQFIPCVEIDAETGRVADYSISPEQYGRFLCAIFEEWIRNGIPKVYIRDFEEILFNYVVKETPGCIYSRSCGHYIVVEYNGDVYPCDFYVEPQWFLGNLTEQPLEEIIESEKFNKFRMMKIQLARKCEGCAWLQYCHGGCPKHWGISGLDRNYFCFSYKMFFKKSHKQFLRLARLIKAKYLHMC